VIGYKGEQIESYIGDRFNAIPVHYVWQRENKGTADALLRAKELLDGKFLVLLGDDILDANDLVTLANFDHAVLAYPHAEPERFGVIVLREDGTLDTIIEKPEHPPTNLVSTGAMALTPKIFEYTPTGEGGELYLPTMLTQLANDMPVQVVKATFWQPVGRPEDILVAEEVLRNRKQT
jgi:NDP-sugar pyrophosphorylase family protein